ncbi:MAG: hypothetical protein DCF29_13575 [Alphaproteobacteria bacterium]|nr:MAG: hypothetical protein DCF29_13575 [Alphaproteobacteria bacterium]
MDEMQNIDIKGYVARAIFQSGLELTLDRGDILVVVGPNNAGKSRSLKDISASLESRVEGVVVKEADFIRITPLEDIEAWIEPFRGANGTVSVGGAAFPMSMLKNWWGDQKKGLGKFLHGRSVSELTTRARLADCDPAATYDRRDPFSADHPFQHFHRDDKLELKASKLFRRAFKKDLVIHTGNSKNIPAYVGDRPKPGRGEDRRSSTYLDRIETLDKLEEQGDGMRSFASILGRVLAERRPLIIIDEPEAFLHPPQARLLAEIIGAEAADRQMLLATHSSEVLQGLLGNHSERVSVVRLTRTRKGGGAVLLARKKLQDLWKDPILRFSNVMDGLFHDAVILTEADADCRFYEALASVSTNPEIRPDIHYTYSGGKDRLAVVVTALRALKVPVVTIADFDLLNNEATMSRIVAAHGGNWAKLETDWRTLKAAVEENASFVGADRFKTEMSALIKTVKPGGAVEKTILSNVKALARNASPWDHAKQSGLASLPNGPATQAAKALLGGLKAIGIFVAPVGEMEGFCRSVGGHGPRWVAEVTKRDLARDLELAEGRAFMSEVVDHISKQLA